MVTTDALVTVNLGLGEVHFALSVKPANKLEGDRDEAKRVRQKLEIERVFNQEEGRDWWLTTDDDLPRVVAENVGRVHPVHDREQLDERVPGDGGLTDDDLDSIRELLEYNLPRNGYLLAPAATDADKRLGWHPGMSLSVGFHLIANRRWQVDLTKPIEPRRPLPVVGENPFRPFRAA